MKIRTAIVAVAAVLTLTPAASAHVTLNPGEWEAGGFARFAVRVPNEQDGASTTAVTVRFPENVISASFEDVPGWTRRVQMAQLDQPIQDEGEEITERLASVTWTGGEIEPREFVEFGISFQVPEDAAGGELLFPALQRYSNGEVVRWIDPDPEAESPAPRVTVLEAAEEEVAAAEAPTTTEGTAETAEAAPAPGGDDEDGESGRATLALVVAIAGLVAGLAALAVSLTRSRRSRTA